MERVRFYENNLTRIDNTVVKKTSLKIDTEALTILQNSNLSYIPKIINFSDHHIEYEYIDGIALGTYCKNNDLSVQDYLEIYNFVNKCWIDFASISKEHLPKDKVLYYQDFHLYNLIKTNTGIMIADLDSFGVSTSLHLNTTHCYLFSQLEEIQSL